MPRRAESKVAAEDGCSVEVILKVAAARAAVDVD